MVEPFNTGITPVSVTAIEWLNVILLAFPVVFVTVLAVPGRFRVVATDTVGAFAKVDATRLVTLSLVINVCVA